MCALKIFAPRSIQIDFNENLQGRYRYYLQGNFNHWLDEREYPTAPMGGMHPLRFEEWIVNTYAALVDEDEKKRKRDQIENDYRRKAEPLERIEAEVGAKIRPRKAELKSVIEKRITIESEAAGLDSDITRAQEDLVGLRAEHEDLSKRVGIGGRGMHATLTIQTLETVQLAIEKERDAIRSLEVKRSAIAQTLDAFSALESEIEREIERMEGTVTKVRAEIQKALVDFTRGLGEL
jgi:chromosome segregation ATPase